MFAAIQDPAAHGLNFDNVSYWDGDNASGSPSIKINLGEQRAYFYKGGELVGISVVSTGREGFGTTSGSFHIIQKDKDHVSSRFGDYVDADGNIIKKEIDRDKDPMPKGARYDGAKMPFFMRIVGGTGMHQGFLPGYPASHGCIRMPGFMAHRNCFRERERQSGRRFRLPTDRVRSPKSRSWKRKRGSPVRIRRG